VMSRHVRTYPAMDDVDVRDLHRRIWEMREVDGAHWSQIAQRLGIPEPRLTRIRLAARARARCQRAQRPRDMAPSVRRLASHIGPTATRASPFCSHTRTGAASFG